MERIAYICDGKRDCSIYKHCGVDCTHTVHTLNAKYGICKSVEELHSDRFVKVGSFDETSYFWEVDKSGNTGND